MNVQTTLTVAMKSLISSYNAGAVATVNQDGRPAVSPKATFVIVDSSCIAFGDIRSPGTTANISRNPNVEIVFTDVLARQAVRDAQQMDAYLIELRQLFRDLIGWQILEFELLDDRSANRRSGLATSSTSRRLGRTNS